MVGIGYRLDMDTLGARIKFAREACGLTQDEVASHFHIKRVSVTQWEGDTTKPAIGKIGELARLLNTTTEWLVDRLGAPPSKKEGATPQQRGSEAHRRHTAVESFKPEIIPGSELVGARDFPIYAAAAGGHGHLIVSFDAVEYVKRPAILDGVPGAYGLLVYGDSMSPAYRHGDMALIHPGLGPAADEDVVLYDHPPDGDAEAIIKHLVSWTDREWHLEQYNPPRKWSEARADWETCHRVVGKYGRRR